MRYRDRAIESPAVISKTTPTPIGTAVEIINNFGTACRVGVTLRLFIVIALYTEVSCTDCCGSC